MGNTLNVTYSSVNLFSLIASEITPAYIANNIFYPSSTPNVYTQGLLLLQLVNNTFVNQKSRASIDCLLCVYMEVKGITFTDYTANADALFDIVTLPQIQVALLFNDVRLVNNAFNVYDFRFFMTLTPADTIVFTYLTIESNTFASSRPLVKLPGATTLIIDNVHCSGNSYSNEEV